MKWHALATDFDGTIATDGVVDEPTRLALVRLRSANVRTFLVTGRELSDFKPMGLFLPVFDMIIAENGAVLYDPGSGETRALGAPPSEALIAELSRRGVSPLGVGTSIVATREPYETIVIEVIKELGLELQVIFNKGAVMILPPGINKASGLQAALKSFGLSPGNVIGVGFAGYPGIFAYPMNLLAEFLALGFGSTKSKTLTPNFCSPRYVRPSLAPTIRGRPSVRALPR